MFRPLSRGRAGYDMVGPQLDAPGPYMCVGGFLPLEVSLVHRYVGGERERERESAHSALYPGFVSVLPRGQHVESRDQLGAHPIVTCDNYTPFYYNFFNFIVISH